MSGDTSDRLMAKIDELEARPHLDPYGKAALDLAYALLERATDPGREVQT